MISDILANLFTIKNLLFINIGLAAGIIIGALPGLTATMGVALLLPLTFGMDSITGMLLILGVYCGGIYGGSITAVLIKTPGTPASAATILDGYIMAKQGRAGEALEMALKASTIAGLFSAFVLLFVAPQLAKFALKFGPPEYFALAVFGLTIISSINSESIIKGLISGMLGMLVSTIGLDPIGGIDRLTFGIDKLAGGINLIPAMIGLFAISEILEKTRTIDHPIGEIEKFKKQNLPWSEVMKYWKTIIKSSAIGTFIGAVPGTGAAIASFLSYNVAKRTSKNPQTFGKGNIEGVAASEAGNNGVTGATLIPLLTLGIPGDTVTAIMLGALMMQGITPGPQLFVRQAYWVYSIMLGLILVNIFMYLQGELFIKAFVNVTRIPSNMLIPILIILCVIGSYAVNNTVFDVGVMLFFGVVGYILTRLDFPITPINIGIILGPLAESNLRRSLSLSEGSYSIFINRPISAIFLLLAIISFVSSIYKTYRQREAKDLSDSI